MGKVTTEEFIKKAINVHKGIYKYDKLKYINSKIGVCITCIKHGDFTQTPNSHLKGSGCPRCGRDAILNVNRAEERGKRFIEAANKKFNFKFDYSKFIYLGSKTKGLIICPIHDEFYRSPHCHLTNKGCPKCSEENQHKRRILTNTEYVIKLKKVWGESVHLIGDYIKSKEKTVFSCYKHGEFISRPNDILSGYGCPVCRYRGVSKEEVVLRDFTCTLDRNNKPNVRGLLKTNKELDIYFEDKNLAIEYCGSHYHSVKFRHWKYHLDKLNECLEKNINLVQLFDWEWSEKQDIVKSRLRQILGCQGDKIMARKCEVKEVSSKDAMEFQRRTHIQGAVGACIRLGLYYENTLVGLMTFGKPRISLGRKKESIQEGEYELLRFCTELNTSIAGGASKLLKYLERTYKPTKIFSYADRRWSQGNVYKKLGFTMVSITKPNYWYTKSGKNISRFSCRKSELVKQGYNPTKSEESIMLDLGYYRVYDCGTLKFEKNI